MGQLGRALEPLVRPLGFDWRGAVALATGFIAKEIMVSSLGVLYAVGDAGTEQETRLSGRIGREFSPLVGLAFMVFVLLFTPCLSTVATIRSETRSRKWAAFAVTYQLALAWVAAFVVHQAGRLLGMA